MTTLHCGRLMDYDKPKGRVLYKRSALIYQIMIHRNHTYVSHLVPS